MRRIATSNAADRDRTLADSIRPANGRHKPGNLWGHGQMVKDTALFPDEVPWL